MKTFRFRLDRVMRWRETALKAEEARLEQLRLHSELAERAIQTAEDSLVRAKLANRESPSVTGAELKVLNDYSAKQVRERPVLKQRLAVADEAVDQQRQNIAGRRRDVRLLERLRDRRSAEWLVKSNQEEEIFAGEFSIDRWIRERAGADRLTNGDVELPSHLRDDGLPASQL